MPEQAPSPSARQLDLLEAAYRYSLDHGLADLSLRPLSAAIGTSPRVLMFLFGNKEGLVRALLERARADELALLDDLTSGRDAQGLVAAAEQVWAWLRAPAHRPLLRLWAEAYARSLVEPDGAWRGFAAATVDDWLGVLASCQPEFERGNPGEEVRRTAVLGILRGCLLDLLATDDVARVDAAVRLQLDLLPPVRGRGR
jgi:AcrR family transcriptional regulator